VPYCESVLSPNATLATTCTYRGDFAGQSDVLGQAQLALLERALEVGLLDRFACIALLVDERDEAVLDLQVHLGSLDNLLLEVAAGLDAESLTAMDMVSAMSSSLFR
jgi:hypothetical protein